MVLIITVSALAAACGVTNLEQMTERQLEELPATAVAQETPVSQLRVVPTLTQTAVPADTIVPSPTGSQVSAPEAKANPLPTVTPLPLTEVTASATTETSQTPLPAGKIDGVLPDPDYEKALNAARLSTRDWDTDFRLHTVLYSEIRSVIPRDNIPSIDAPVFLSPAEASGWLKDVEPVVSLEIEGDARAYPLQILTWHEIVNDVVGEVPVAVTFCPLCNSAIAFDSSLDGTVLEFGVSGNLRNSDLIMYDRQTHSWWQQFTGEGIVGEHAGRNLELLPASIVSFADFKDAHPDGRVLSRDTGYDRQYGRNPYAGYDTFGGNPFLFTGDLDGRLLPVERVIAVTLDGVDVAFPLTLLQEEGVINFELNDTHIAVFHKFGTTSALDASSIADSRDVGATGVFESALNDEMLTFSVQDGAIVDDQTGSTWDILGNAVAGPLAGENLLPVVHGNHFWFAWAVFKPDTILYAGADSS